MRGAAKPVGQQRKEGKRESTGEALEDSRRNPDIGKPGEGPIYQPVSKKDGSGSVDVERKWQQEMASGFEKIKTDLKNGTITPEEAKSQISELNSRSKEFVTRGKQEREQGLKDDAAVYKRREDRKKQRDGGQPPAAPDQPSSAQPSDPGSAKSPGEAKAPAATPQPEQEQPEEKAKWRAPGEGREDTGIVEEVRTGGSGTGGGMLSAQSRPVIGPWARNENEYKQSITSAFDRLIKDEVESQYEGLGGVRDPKKKIGIESKIYSDPKELEYVIKDTIRDFVSKDKNLQGTDFDDFARNHLNKLIAYRTGQDVEEEPSAPATPAPAAAAPGGQEAAGPAPAAPPKKPGRGLNVPAQPARKSGGGVPFTPEVGKQATDAIRQAVSEGKSPQEVVNEFKQGNLFPGGLITDTAQTNPLEGGSTPASPGPSGTAPTQEEKGGSLLDEQGQAKDFRKSGPQPTGGGTARQLPLPLGRENTAAKLKGRADVENRRLAKQEKSLGKPSPRPRKAGKSPTQPDLFTKSGNPRKFNTSEMSSMSYDEFSQSVRSMMR
jgi:hypothetical protein